MKESQFWSTIVKPQLSSFGVLHRIENTVESGTPDVTYSLRHPAKPRNVSGWIELKVTKRPVRQETIVRFKRFTVEQAEWLREWSAVGSSAWLLTMIGPYFTLIDGRHCPRVQAGVTLREFQELSSVIGSNRFPTGRILDCLTR